MKSDDLLDYQKKENLTISNLRNTINQVFNIYESSGKKYFRLSVDFLLVSTIFSVILSLIVCYAVSNVIKPVEYGIGGEAYSFFDYNVVWFKMYEIGVSISILNMGLYGIFLNQHNSYEFNEKYRLRNIRQELSKTVWNQYFTLLVILLIIHIVLFEDLFDVNDGNGGIFEVLNTYEFQTKSSRFYAWINSIIYLAKLFIPFVFSMILVMYSYHKKLSFNLLKKYKSAIFTGLILSFFIEIFSENIFYYMKHYVVEVISIPFENYLFSAGIVIVISLVVGAFFLLAFATAISFPFKLEYQKLEYE